MGVGKSVCLLCVALLFVFVVFFSFSSRLLTARSIYIYFSAIFFRARRWNKRKVCRRHRSIESIMSIWNGLQQQSRCMAVAVEGGLLFENSKGARLLLFPPPTLDLRNPSRCPATLSVYVSRSGDSGNNSSMGLPI